MAILSAVRHGQHPERLLPQAARLRLRPALILAAVVLAAAAAAAAAAVASASAVQSFSTVPLV